MLYGNIKDRRWIGAETLARALKFVADEAPALADGRYELADGMFAHVKSVEPVDAAAKAFESHGEYADLHCALAGKEGVFVAPREGLGVVEDHLAADDVCVYGKPAEDAIRRFVLEAGDYLLLMPEDAHKPECFCGFARTRKCIVKIPVASLR